MRIHLLLASFVVLGCGDVSAQRPPGESWDVGTHHLHLYSRGDDDPVVIIDTGLGDSAQGWFPIQRRLAPAARVCLWDRAGYGRSEAGPFPRDSQRAAKETKALLDAASVPGPYVVVGHSLGAVNMMIFAATYPDDVAGLILLDPPPLSWIRGEGFPELREMAEAMTREWEQRGEIRPSLDDAAKREARFFATLASEHREMFGQSADRAASIETFGTFPLLVVSAGRDNPQFGEHAVAFGEMWKRESRVLASKSENGRWITIEESGHAFHVDARDRLVAIVLEMVERVRGNERGESR